MQSITQQAINQVHGGSQADTVNRAKDIISGFRKLASASRNLDELVSRLEEDLELVRNKLAVK